MPPRRQPPRTHEVIGLRDTSQRLVFLTSFQLIQRASLTGLQKLQGGCKERLLPVTVLFEDLVTMCESEHVRTVLVHGETLPNAAN